MSRKRPKPIDPRWAHEHVYKRTIRFTCPIDRQHTFGEVFQDVGETHVWPRHVTSEWRPGDTRQTEVDFRRDGEKLRGKCFSCAQRGIRPDYVVRWDRVIEALDAMADHAGENVVRVELSAEALRSFVERRIADAHRYVIDHEAIKADRERRAPVDGSRNS